MFKPTGSYKFSRELKRLLAGKLTDPEFSTWYKSKIIQIDLENELKTKSPKKDVKPTEQIPE
jgi:hypothetical protein